MVHANLGFVIHRWYILFLPCGRGFILCKKKHHHFKQINVFQVQISGYQQLPETVEWPQVAIANPLKHGNWSSNNDDGDDDQFSHIQVYSKCFNFLLEDILC